MNFDYEENYIHYLQIKVKLELGYKEAKKLFHILGDRKVQEVYGDSFTNELKEKLKEVCS